MDYGFKLYMYVVYMPLTITLSGKYEEIINYYVISFIIKSIVLLCESVECPAINNIKHLRTKYVVLCIKTNALTDTLYSKQNLANIHINNLLGIVYEQKEITI